MAVRAVRTPPSVEMATRPRRRSQSQVIMVITVIIVINDLHAGGRRGNSRPMSKLNSTTTHFNTHLDSHVVDVGRYVSRLPSCSRSCDPKEKHVCYGRYVLLKPFPGY